jgi:tetratricopeptide (TPR) repeat protein
MTRCRTVVPIRRWALGLALGAAGTLPLLGCKDLTSVSAPDVRQPANYATAAGASALAIGAMTRFNLAFGGADATLKIGRNQVMQSAQIADELFAAASNLSEIDWDRRNPIDPSSGGSQLYNPLHSARINLLTAIASFERIAPDSSARIGQLYALVGYTEAFLGENFCAGESLGRLDADFRPLYGPPLTTQQVYEQAVADFDSALAYAADSARLVQLAQVGKGRVLLDLGRFSEAAQAVASVPTSFVYNAAYVTGTLHNGVYGTGTQDWFTVAEREGGNGLNWRTANDPRVPLVNRSPALMGADGVTEIWAFVPYQASNAPIRLASGIEARLIEAEAALQAIHNTLRATVPGLAPLADPVGAAARVDLHFRERAFWLFLTGHRHGDLRRLVRQYGRDAETVFPIGAWRDGQTYGTATNLAPGSEARNDPNYHGCLDRNA